ncbi:zinc finger protein 37-like [Contarinia nasturtii]|uniref:zinc finger protein 37-like n=1 Tax=Contarinia nasturtii TaxID=265458 RepID=UPI0012D3E778|nr:zinc finger protein 37-like [Contarinia nasturtii]XP_031639351.1 zinc finger protein 37-like [Contarinia nasturtii]
MVSIDGIDVKLEPIDVDDLEIVMSNRRAGSLSFKNAPNIQSLLTMSNELRAQERSLSPQRLMNTKHWMEEVSDLTALLVRQTHETLEHIKNDFTKKNIKFNNEFRNHFFYIVNNRLREAYDSFLIELPREMRSEEMVVHKPPTIVLKARSDTHKDKALNPPSKRQRIDNETMNESVRITKNVTNTNPKIDKTQIIEQKMVSKVMQTSTSVTKTSTNSMTQCNRYSISNKFANLRSVDEIQKSQQLNRSLEKAKSNLEEANKRLILVETNKSMSGIQRRKSVGAPLMYGNTNQPIKCMTISVKQTANKCQNNDIATKIQPNKVVARRKTFAVKDLVTNNKKPNNDNGKKPQKQTIKLAVSPVKEMASVSVKKDTAPLSNGVYNTRSRRSNRKSFGGAFTCDECDYSSDVRTNLQRHMRNHTGERPFKCKHCAKDFLQKVNLKSHMKANHHEHHFDPAYWKAVE